MCARVSSLLGWLDLGEAGHSEVSLTAGQVCTVAEQLRFRLTGDTNHTHK